MLDWIGWIGYLQTGPFLDHLAVIKRRSRFLDAVASLTSNPVSQKALEDPLTLHYRDGNVPLALAMSWLFKT